MLKVASDDKTFLCLVNAYTNNRKFKFDVRAGKWSITVRGDLDAAENIFNLCMPSMTPVRMKRFGSCLFIYDSDVYLNRRFLQIFAPVPQKATHAGLTVSLSA